MNWLLHRVVFQALSPIHIGGHRLGIIARTRYFIPATNLWGSWIAAWARRYLTGGNPNAIYRRAEDHLFSRLRFTPLYIVSNHSGVLRPRFTSELGLSFGNLAAADFEATYISGQASAAIDAQRFVSQHGALHEKEFLASPSPEPLTFTGYVLARDLETWEMLQPVISSFSIGADQSYGWGRLKLLTSEPAGDIFGEFQLAGASRIAPLRPGSYLPAPVPFEPQSSPAFAGELQVLVGRRHDSQRGSGRSIPESMLCWSPGTRLSGAELAFYWQFDGSWTVCA